MSPTPHPPAGQEKRVGCASEADQVPLAGTTLLLSHRMWGKGENGPLPQSTSSFRPETRQARALEPESKPPPNVRP